MESTTTAQKIHPGAMELVNEKSLGSGWLKKGVEELLDSRGEDCTSFILLNGECRKKKDWDPALLFPERTLNAEDVEKLTVEELIKLPGSQFFALVDLISGKKAMQILQSPDVGQFRKLSLYFFSKNFSNFFSQKQKELYTAPIETRVKSIADDIFKQSSLIAPGEFTALMEKPAYAKLDAVRNTASETLSGTSNRVRKPEMQELARKKWKLLNNTYLSKGIEKPITSEFLDIINTAVQASTESCTMRMTTEEVGDPASNMFYLPGKGVKQNMNDFIIWLNEQIAGADEDPTKFNPIVIAASAYQRFVSIHPYMDGNGRTGRLLADLILRRYQLPPAAWNTCSIAVFPAGGKASPSPTTVVESLIEALKKSYLILAEKEIDNPVFTGSFVDPTLRTMDGLAGIRKKDEIEIGERSLHTFDLKGKKEDSLEVSQEDALELALKILDVSQ